MWTTYGYQLARLQRQKARISESYRKDIEAAKRSKKSADDIERLVYEDRMECDLVDDEILALQTKYLIRQAEKYLVPLPSLDDWEESLISSRRHLSLKAASELRTIIRREQKERSEQLRGWLASVTGLVGTLIGLVSLIAGLRRH